MSICWTYEQVALAVGYCILGEGLNSIARHLGTNAADVRKTLAEVHEHTGERDLLLKLPCEGAKDRPSNPRPLHQLPVVHNPQTEVFRRWRVADRRDWPEGRGNITADLMGDPSPERSALHQSSLKF